MRRNPSRGTSVRASMLCVFKRLARRSATGDPFRARRESATDCRAPAAYILSKALARAGREKCVCVELLLLLLLLLLQCWWGTASSRTLLTHRPSCSLTCASYLCELPARLRNRCVQGFACGEVRGFFRRGDIICQGVRIRMAYMDRWVAESRYVAQGTLQALFAMCRSENKCFFFYDFARQRYMKLWFTRPRV